MYCKIEPTGCCERKGLVQIRLCFYLDEDDYGYDTHHILVPDIPDGEKYPEFTGVVSTVVDTPELGKVSVSTDEYKKWLDGYTKWIDSFPKVWQNNPFHNHFIYVEPDTSEKEIMLLAEAYLHETGFKWSCDEKIDCKNYGVKFPATVTKDRLIACADKVQSVKSITTEVKA